MSEFNDAFRDLLVSRSFTFAEWAKELGVTEHQVLMYISTSTVLPKPEVLERAILAYARDPKTDGAVMAKFWETINQPINEVTTYNPRQFLPGKPPATIWEYILDGHRDKVKEDTFDIELFVVFLSCFLLAPMVIVLLLAMLLGK